MINQRGRAIVMIFATLLPPPPPPPQKKKEKKRYDIRIQVELGLRCPACRALIIVKRLKDVGRLLER